MNEPATAPALASVIVLTLRNFTRSPVPEQARMKAQLEALVATAIRPLRAAERIVLDAPEGAAVVVLDDPEKALQLAERAEAAAADLSLTIGVNHGPVKVVSDARRGTGIVGDGVAAALTLASAAEPGRFVASRAFHEELESVAPARAAELDSAGMITDLRLRTHELFTRNRQAANARRRKLYGFGALMVAAIVGLGIAARAELRKELPPRPAYIEFQITPRGEIVVDGVVKGTSPPLTRLELSAGAHRIEVRNRAFPPLVAEVNLGPDEQMTLSHSFANPKRKSADEGYWQRMRRKVGF
jgi:hypothetical protein